MSMNKYLTTSKETHTNTIMAEMNVSHLPPIPRSLNRPPKMAVQQHRRECRKKLITTTRNRLHAQERSNTPADKRVMSIRNCPRVQPARLPHIGAAYSEFIVSQSDIAFISSPKVDTYYSSDDSGNDDTFISSSVSSGSYSIKTTSTDSCVESTNSKQKSKHSCSKKLRNEQRLNTIQKQSPLLERFLDDVELSYTGHSNCELSEEHDIPALHLETYTVSNSESKEEITSSFGNTSVAKHYSDSDSSMSANELSITHSTLPSERWENSHTLDSSSMFYNSSGFFAQNNLNTDSSHHQSTNSSISVNELSNTQSYVLEQEMENCDSSSRFYYNSSFSDESANLGISNVSDMSHFMEQPLTSQMPVTRFVKDDKKKSIGKKLKQMGKYLKLGGNTSRQNGQFQVLGVV